MHLHTCKKRVHFKSFANLFTNESYIEIYIKIQSAKPFTKSLEVYV